MPIFASFVCGLVFGCGLTVSSMIQPAKVLGFLDVFGIRSGAWEPSLAVVLATGLAVAGIGELLSTGAAPITVVREGKPMANEERYRSVPPIRSAPVWRRLGSCWTVSWTRGREPRDAFVAGDHFCHRDGTRHAGA